MTTQRLGRIATAALTIIGALAITQALMLGSTAHGDAVVDELGSQLSVDSTYRLDSLRVYFDQWGDVARLLATDPEIVADARRAAFNTDPDRQLNEVALLSGAFPGEVIRPRLVPLGLVPELEVVSTPGTVHHSAPHPLRGIGTWVVTTSAVVGVLEPTAILQLSIPLEEYRRQMPDDGLHDVHVVETTTGLTVFDAVEAARWQDDPADGLGDLTVPLLGEQDVVREGGRLHAISRASWGRAGTLNDNDWAVIVSNDVPTDPGVALDGRSVSLLILGVVLIFGAIVRGLHRQRDLRRVAETDELTGLGNRRAFRLQAQSVIDQATGECHLVLLDLDRFKEVNDTYGHDVGDEVLRRVSSRLLEHLPNGTVLARTGGDEFAALVDVREHDLDDVLTVISDALQTPLVLDHGPVLTSASIGVATLPDHATDVSAALRKADIAMFRAKGARGHVVRYEPSMDPDNPRRVKVHQELVRALADGQVRAHFQPKVDVRTRAITGFEALARWTHPELGPVSPGEFVPIAQDRGLMPALTTAMLAQSVEFLDSLGGEHDISVSVNISPVLLHSEEFIDQIGDLLARSSIPEGALILELTEDLLVGDSQGDLDALERLRQLGCRVSIDDFGTGHSSLGYLARLPADELKIDRSFMTDLEGDASKAFILSTTIELGRRLGLTVVAEGVETQGMWDFLQSLGCDVVQGWLVAPGMPADVARRWCLQGDGVWSGETVRV